MTANDPGQTGSEGSVSHCVLDKIHTVRDRRGEIEREGGGGRRGRQRGREGGAEGREGGRDKARQRERDLGRRACVWTAAVIEVCEVLEAMCVRM